MFVLVLGHHSNLVLASREHGLVRYAYGDWRWYAEAETGPWAGIAALLWPTPAALGRHAVPGPPTASSLRRELPVAIDRLHRLHAPASAVDALAAELDALFRDGGGTLTRRAEYGLSFARHPVPYTALHNSNRVVVQWLRRLGFEAHGGHLVTRWVIVEGAPGAASAR